MSFGSLEKVSRGRPSSLVGKCGTIGIPGIRSVAVVPVKQGRSPGLVMDSVLSISEPGSLNIGARIGEYKKEETHVVMMREMAVTNARSVRPIIGTYGAVSCIIVGAYNEVTREAFLAHVDDGNGFGEVMYRLRELGGDETNKVKVYLAGGVKKEERNEMLLKLIQSERSLAVVENHLGKSIGIGGWSFAIDARSGKISWECGAKDLYDPKWGKINGIEFMNTAMKYLARGEEVPMELVYDGRKEELAVEEKKEEVCVCEEVD